MTTTHTPGPWVCRDIYVMPEHHYGLPIGGAVNLDDHVNNYAHVIACVSDDDRRFGKETWKANARLIASAPELLEVLKDVVSMLDDLRLRSDADQEGAVTEQIREANAVIAKATGAPA
jgi:hypothetical protein